MPTGYTSSIKNGSTFKEFAMDCARAFGACVTLRDDTSQLIPKEFKASPYHQDEMLKIQKRIDKVRKMTVAQAEKESQKQYNNEIKTREERIEKNNKQINLYKNMLSQVMKWTPPTPEHTDLRDFMIKQLNSSIKFDDMSEFYKKDKIVLLSGLKWLEKEQLDIVENFEYHEKEYREEVTRVTGRNKWISELRGSLI